MNLNNNTGFQIRKPENDSKLPLQFCYKPAQNPVGYAQPRSYSTSYVGGGPLSSEQRIGQTQEPLRIFNNQENPIAQPKSTWNAELQGNVYQGFQLNSQRILGQNSTNNAQPTQDPQHLNNSQRIFPNLTNQNNKNPNYQSLTPQTEGFFGNAPVQQSAINNGSQQLQGSNPLQTRSPFIAKQPNNGKPDLLPLNRQTSQSRSVQNPLNLETRSQVNPTPSFRPEMNDNLSYHSKMSTNSRNHVLRPLSVNNEEHYHTLNSKVDTLKDSNVIIARNYFQNIDGTKKNVLRNMSDNYSSKVNEIWSSYLNDQLKTGGQRGDVANLNKDVEMIKGVFFDYLMSKTELFMEDLKSRKMKEVFADIEASQNQRKYIDERVQSIVDNDYAVAQTKNKELKNRLEESKTSYKQIIEQTVAKYKKLREDHMGMYNREFTFKLNGDQNLVKNTLKNAIPFLQEEGNKSEAKLTKVRNLGNFGVSETLKKQIELLENELKFHKKS